MRAHDEQTPHASWSFGVRQFKARATSSAKSFFPMPSSHVNSSAPGSRSDIAALAALGGTPEKRAVFGSVVDDFYLTNPIARASTVMAGCSVIAEGDDAERNAAE